MYTGSYQGKHHDCVPQHAESEAHTTDGAKKPLAPSRHSSKEWESRGGGEGRSGQGGQGVEEAGVVGTGCGKLKLSSGGASC